MFALANDVATLAKIAFETAADVLGQTSSSGLKVEIEHVEFKNVEVKTGEFTHLDDDFTLVEHPSIYPQGKPSDLPTRLKAATVYLQESDPTKKENAKNAFLLLAGYDTPWEVPDEVATTIAEACIQELSCQSLKRQLELTKVPTSSLPTVSVISHVPLSDLVRDYVKPVVL
jgi:hypothetical protein